MRAVDENEGILQRLIGDGTFFILLTGLALCFAGCFALFLTFSGYFLPHDANHIGLTAEQLSLSAPNLVRFMFHDRAAFGGAIFSIGIIYMWLAAYPLTNRSAWAWWTLLISGIFGFGSFLAYIGYGYLDSWHGIATLFLLPIFVYGLFVSAKHVDVSQKPNWNPVQGYFKAPRRHRFALLLLLCYAFGLILAGASISIIGMTAVFVPQDIQFINMCGEVNIEALSPNLLPVIAHDRAGFGGGLLTTGITIWLILLNARPSKSLWQTLLVSGLIGFGSAIGIHFYVGYTDFIHLLPAYLGCSIFVYGITYSHTSMCKGGKIKPRPNAP